jgi:predicted dehydrogenase
VVAIADMNKAHARSVAGRHGIPGIYADFHELLARRDIQAVDVCLHNNLHMACQRGRPRSRQTRLP